MILKIRNGFVTNSSSTSFTVVAKKEYDLNNVADISQNISIQAMKGKSLLELYSNYLVAEEYGDMHDLEFFSERELIEILKEQNVPNSVIKLMLMKDEINSGTLAKIDKTKKDYNYLIQLVVDNDDLDEFQSLLKEKLKKGNILILEEKER